MQNNQFVGSERMISQEEVLIQFLEIEEMDSGKQIFLTFGKRE